MPIPLKWQWKFDRLREKIAGWFHSDPSNARPQMCPSCGTLVGTKATKCHQCGANLRFGLAAASRSLGRLMPAASPVTYILLTACCLFYGISVLFTIRLGASMVPEGGGLGALFNIGAIAGRALDLLGATIPAPYIYQQPWRLVTAIFLHGSLLHILFNMWVLMDIGPIVEELYGSARYLFLFIATGVVGYVVSSFIGYSSVGASGALLGLIGLLLAATTNRGGIAAKMLRSNLIRWVVYILIMGFMFQGIDNAAHIGGLAAGFGLGKIFADRQPQGASERRRAYALGWATAATVIACFVFMMMEFYQNR